MRVGPAVADEERAALYVRHKFERGLTADGETREVDVAAYRAFLVETCCDTVEFACRAKGELVAVAVADRGSQSLSAVYCAFAPGFAGVSLGTYCILKQIEACRAWGLRYLYLGLYVADCRHLAYKARFLPHERLIQGEWRRFDRPAPPLALTISAKSDPKGFLSGRRHRVPACTFVILGLAHSVCSVCHCQAQQCREADDMLASCRRAGWRCRKSDTPLARHHSAALASP